MKNKTKTKLLSAGLIITALTAVAGISYMVSANQKGLDETNNAIKEIIGDRYSFVTDTGSKHFKKVDTLEKMYITNEADLAVSEYTTEKAYRTATYDSIITDDYSEEDYLEENEGIKVFTLEDVEMKTHESFIIKNLFDGNILENEEKELVITDHYASQGSDLVEMNYESELEVAQSGVYDFYLISSEDEIELIVNFTAVSE